MEAVLTLNPSQSFLFAHEALLKELHALLSFKNKSVQNEIGRFTSSIRAKDQMHYSNEGELPQWYVEWKAEKFKDLYDRLTVFCSTLVEEDGEIAALAVPTGLAHRVKAHCQEKGIPLQIVDTRPFDDLGRRSFVGEKPRALRRPQAEGLAAIEKEDLCPTLRGIGLLRIATGVGKTALAEEIIRRKKHRTVFLVPTTPILNQTVKRFTRAFGMKNVSAFGGGKKTTAYITVATYQSVNKAPEGTFDDVEMVIADEAHMCGAETFYDAVYKKLGNASYRYSLTAYEERADGGTMLVEAACGPVVYSYDAADGIRDGYLAKPSFIVYNVTRTEGQWTQYREVDGVRKAVREVISKSYDGRDSLDAYRHWVLGNNLLNGAIRDLTNAFVEEGKSVLILVDEKEHGDRLVALLPGAGFAVGGSKDNDQLQADFNKRQLKVLIGTSTLGMGADTVAVDVLINLQGGASISQTKQANGRALRNEEDENGVVRKPTSLIIDFDFPYCSLLAKHSEVRAKVHEEIGEISRATLV